MAKFLVQPKYPQNAADVAVIADSYEVDDAGDLWFYDKADKHVGTFSRSTWISCLQVADTVSVTSPAPRPAPFRRRGDHL